MYPKNFPHKRYRITTDFINKHIDKSELILDLGIKNPLSEALKEDGFQIINTNGEDLDIDQSLILETKATVVTAFQIFEHLLNPFQILNSIKAKKLVCSIPLRLWFAKAYRNFNDIRDNHFHEFEDWQFDWLLQKSGWKIIRKEKWIKPSFVPGIRTILRNFSKRYYAIEAVKK